MIKQIDLMFRTMVTEFQQRASMIGRKTSPRWVDFMTVAVDGRTCLGSDQPASACAILGGRLLRNPSSTQ